MGSLELPICGWHLKWGQTCGTEPLLTPRTSVRTELNCWRPKLVSENWRIGVEKKQQHVFGVGCGENPQVLGWPKSSFRFFCNILWKNQNELFGQPNIYLKLAGHVVWCLSLVLERFQPLSLQIFLLLLSFLLLAFQWHICYAFLYCSTDFVCSILFLNYFFSLHLSLESFH